MNKKRSIKHVPQPIGLLFTILLLFSGCYRETDVQGPDSVPADGYVRVELFTRAYGFNTPVTRATDEYDVERTPWVLVFEGNDDNAVCVEAVRANNSLNPNKTYVDLKARETHCRLLILANLQSRFYLYGGGNYTPYTVDAGGSHHFEADLLEQTVAQVCNSLFTEPLMDLQESVPFDGELLPMSYIYEASAINSDTRLVGEGGSSLPLCRAVAKITVKNVASNFVLSGVSAVCNAPQRGLWHNLDGMLPEGEKTGLVNYRTASENNIAEAKVAYGTQSTEDNPIYLYESATPNETCIIVKGDYNGTTYFYKMRLADEEGNALAIFRNHQYEFTIKNINSLGYDKLDDAIESKALNNDLNFTITVTDASAFEIIANNDYYLAVSNSVFIAYVGNDINSDNEKWGGVFDAFTVVTNCTRNFPIANEITDNCDDVGGQFNLEYPSRIRTADNASTPAPTPVLVLVQAWLQYEAIDAYITLKLGDLEKKVQVRQRNEILAGGATLEYKPTTNDFPWSNEVNYYCLSGYVEDDATSWIKLTSSNDTANGYADITVDNGAINIRVERNGGDQRTGVVYLTTIGNPNDSSNMNSVQRIKISITQQALQLN